MPRIIVRLPDNIESDGVWIRYSLSGPGSSGKTISRGIKIKQKANRRQYVIDAVIGEHAEIVIYAPGCQFKTFTLDVGATDISEQFECVPLPTKTVHGLLPTSQIPLSLVAAEKKLNIVGELEGNWVCDFLLQERRGSTLIIAGSCLGSSIPLGTVGELDPSKGGAFEIVIPDFARDPVFLGTGEAPRSGSFDVMHLGLYDKTIGRGLGAIKAEGAGSTLGLDVQVEYSDPVMFKRVR